LVQQKNLLRQALLSVSSSSICSEEEEQQQATISATIATQASMAEEQEEQEEKKTNPNDAGEKEAKVPARNSRNCSLPLPFASLKCCHRLCLLVCVWLA
jgi:hypothetical protein